MNFAWLCLCTVLLFANGCKAVKHKANQNAPANEGIHEQTEQPEAISLFREPLYRPFMPPERKKELEETLARAKTEYNQNPDDPERIIWLGRRTAYLWRYREAIEIYARGIENHPNYAKLYRHRGHRYITLREFDKAIADLEKAVILIQGVPDEIEPDGAPNKFNIPRSTSHSNIWYHYNEQVDKAKEIFQKVTAGNYWAAFGYIAAEADLKRLQ